MNQNKGAMRNDMNESRFCFSAEIFNKKKGDENMDIYQKRKKRQEMKSNENKEEMQNQMNINWYPRSYGKGAK